MTLNDYIEELPGQVEVLLKEKGLTEVKVEKTLVTKHNDTALHGLMFRREGDMMCPTFYLEELYDAMGEDAPLNIAARELVKAYIEAENPRLQAMGCDVSLERMSGQIGFRILDEDRNGEYLERLPHVNMCGSMVMIADISLDHSGQWRTVVTRELLEESGFTEEKLFEVAVNNCTKNDPPILTELEDDIEGRAVNLLERDRQDFPERRACVLSNTSRRFGAGVMFYPGVLKKAAYLMGGFTVIPSSVHETILLPDSLGVPEDVMQFMLNDANDKYVDPREILTDKLFHVDGKGVISPVVRAEMRTAVRQETI